MHNWGFSPTARVGDTMNEHPASAQVFLRFQMACVGCYVARFCSLRDAANAYGVDEPAFLDALTQAAQRDSIEVRSNAKGENE